MSKKRLIIISVVVVIIIAVIAVIACLLLKQDSNNSAEKEKIAWQEAYKTYLLGKIPNTSDYPNLEMQLVYLNDEEIPVLLIRYDYEQNKFIDITLVDEAGKTIAAGGTSGIGKLKILYNKESEKYEWFICREYETYHAYTNLKDFVESAKAAFVSNGTDNSVEVEEYTIYKAATNKSTREKEFESKYVDTNSDDSTNNWISFNADDYKDNLSNLIKDEANKNKKSNTVISEEIKTKIISEVEADKKAEEEAKAKQEAAEKAAAEDAKKSLKVGNCTLKYGTYVSDVSRIESGYNSTITLKPNGEFYIKSNYSEVDGNLYNGKSMDCDGTYVIELNQPTGYPDEYANYIRFKPNTGGSFVFEVFTNNSFSDQWHGYSYSGN